MFTPETHPSNEAVNALVEKYPKTCASLFQVYNDVLYAQSWTDVQVIDLGSSCPRGAVKGKKPTSESDEDAYVVPCELSETLSFAWLQDAFKALSNPAEIYLGISAEDSSIVYYKLSSGIVKPPL